MSRRPKSCSKFSSASEWERCLFAHSGRMRPFLAEICPNCFPPSSCQTVWSNLKVNNLAMQISFSPRTICLFAFLLLTLTCSASFHNSPNSPHTNVVPHNVTVIKRRLYDLICSLYLSKGLKHRYMRRHNGSVMKWEWLQTNWVICLLILCTQSACEIQLHSMPPVSGGSQLILSES